MHYLEPSRTLGRTYARTRRDTLNFEASGGERHVPDATSAATLAAVLPFPRAPRAWITVNIHRKDTTMTDHREDRAREGASADAATLERTSTYSPSGRLHARVITQSGDLVVRATDSSDVVLTLRASSPKYAHLLETAEVVFDAAHDTLTVRTLPKGRTARGPRGGRSWLDFGSSDLDVVLEVPRGSSLDVTTVSGDTRLVGSLGAVAVKSVSGDVVAHDTAEALEVQTASGDVKSGHVLTTMKCKSASGDVVCHGAAAHTEIYSASGDVLLSADQPGQIVVRNVSGSVVVRVARGLAVDISGNTVSGSMGSNIELSEDDGDSSDEDAIVIKVATVSGDIRIDKAS